MADKLTSERRSWNMSRIRSKNTTPEKLVRSILHRLGYRLRLHDSSLPGKPDFVLKKYRTVIFVHGCFWHRHSRCRKNRLTSTRTDFWEAKLSANVARDRSQFKELIQLGQKVVTVWEC
jgi:DNA mismatch endonuclease (patch repair protein)